MKFSTDINHSLPKEFAILFLVASIQAAPQSSRRQTLKSRRTTTEQPPPRYDELFTHTQGPPSYSQLFAKCKENCHPSFGTCGSTKKLKELAKEYGVLKIFVNMTLKTNWYNDGQVCICNLGYHTSTCTKKCPEGKWGPHCWKYCTDDCWGGCDHEVGLCRAGELYRNTSEELPCAGNPCQKDFGRLSVCEVVRGGYTCRCEDYHRQYGDNECRPCIYPEHGKRCHKKCGNCAKPHCDPDDGCFQCAPGWEAPPLCSKLTECKPKSCANFGICKKKKRKCECPLGYSGGMCQIFDPIKVGARCTRHGATENADRHYCKGNGMCIWRRDSDFTKRACVCYRGYYGSKCSHRCTYDYTCLYGTCVVKKDQQRTRVKCECREGYTGRHCGKSLQGYRRCALQDYGPPRCANQCGHCKNDKPCDDILGWCPDFECSEDYVGPFCRTRTTLFQIKFQTAVEVVHTAYTIAFPDTDESDERTLGPQHINWMTNRLRQFMIMKRTTDEEISLENIKIILRRKKLYDVNDTVVKKKGFLGIRTSQNLYRSKHKNRISRQASSNTRRLPSDFDARSIEKKLSSRVSRQALSFPSSIDITFTSIYFSNYRNGSGLPSESEYVNSILQNAHKFEYLGYEINRESVKVSNVFVEETKSASSQASGENKDSSIRTIIVVSFSVVFCIVLCCSIVFIYWRRKIGRKSVSQNIQKKTRTTAALRHMSVSTPDGSC